MKKLTSKFYLVGIKGTGMSALAKLLHDEGCYVTGSDSNEQFFTEDSLICRGIEIKEFNKVNVTNEYYYIIGNSYDTENCEVSEIISNNYKYCYYHEFIGNMKNKQLIAVSGTHGKTTTTSFIVNLLNHKCSYIIGDGTGFGYKENNLLVLEACEYKEHFLKYNPNLLIINNIELDHTDYYKNEKSLIKSFQKLSNKSKQILVNGDDKNIKKIKHQNKITFGFNKNCDVKIKILVKNENGYYVSIKYKDEKFLKIPFTGKHMIYNFVAAYIACILVNKDPFLKEDYSLPKRRMETVSFKKSILIKDYAHHPTEIKALYDSIISKYNDKKINVIFQSHTYERTIKFKNKFKASLNLFDKVYLMDVFSSKREKESTILQKKVDKIYKKYNKFNEVILKEIGENEDIWVFLGAGTASNLIKKIENENK